MHDVGMEVTVDLHGKARSEPAARLLNELRAALNNASATAYSLDVKGLDARPVAGGLVRISCSQWSAQNNLWPLLEQLPSVYASLKASGSDHFPAAGLYSASTLPRFGILGAAATVTHKIDREYPLSDDVVEQVVRAVERDGGWTTGINLDLPISYRRTWSLILRAPTLQRATRAYTLLRGGEWEPAAPFTDTVPDHLKVRLLTQRVEEE